MNIDFHYYGTYAAAREAGYDDASAIEIARSAQYVDDFDTSDAKELTGREGTFKTTQSSFRLLWDAFQLARKGIANIFADDEEKNRIDREFNKANLIWAFFHFLPGMNISYYRDRQKPSAPEISDKELALLTRPNGFLVADIIEFCKSKATSLQRIGVCMHIIADTWAHQDFAGIRSKKLNNVVNKIESEAGFYIPTPDVGSGIVFLGHGRAGHLPDYTGDTLRYCPSWMSSNSDETQMRDNKVEFYDAYIHLVKYMKDIRNNQNNSLNGNQDVQNILCGFTKDAKAQWEVYISSKYPDSSIVKGLKSVKMKDAELEKFVDEMELYYSLVYELLINNGIDLSKFDSYQF